MYHFIDFTGKKIVVAGASSGIGRQTAITLSRLGAQIVLIARREAQLEETKSMLEGEGHAIYVADLSVLDSIAPLVKEIVAQQGRLDGLVFSVGVSKMMPITTATPENVLDTFKTNFFSFAEFTRQITRKGRFNEGMRIVGLSSVASEVGRKGHFAYAASKAAMDSAVRSMSAELAEKGICINAIQPTLVKTQMAEDYAEVLGRSGTEMMMLLRQNRGLCSTEDVANAAVFLLSPAARMINGVALPVDGGLLAGF